MTLGLALGSGGARGWCHIGVLKALADMDVAPDVVAGCSMGALVGAAYCGGRLAALEEWVHDLTVGRFVKLLDVVPARGGLVAGTQIQKLIRDLDLPDRIEDLEKPYAAVATDMETGQEVCIRSGSLADAVRASVALPGVISPIKLNGVWMLDGGLSNPVPVTLARALRAETVIAVNPNAKPDGKIWKQTTRNWGVIVSELPDGLARLLEPVRTVTDTPSYSEVVFSTIDIMTEQIRRSKLEQDPPDVLLNANLNSMSVLELHRGAIAIAEGERMVAEKAAAIRDCLSI